MDGELGGVDNDRILLAHGNGGRLTQELIVSVMLPAFANPMLAQGHDAAIFSVEHSRLAFTTDSFVIKPLFFPGGDIGKLAVCGTVNDLAVSGADPLYLSAGFMIEAGFLLSDLKRIVASMGATACEAGVMIVTGDTKVVEAGAVDGLFINTAGVGRVREHVSVSPHHVTAGQMILLSGTLGEHAIAVLKERHGLVLPDSLVSDCAPLNGLIGSLLAAVPQVAMLRDLTRGGLSTVLCEIAAQANIGIWLEEGAIPLHPAVGAVCDMFGYDPLTLANEGKVVAFVEPSYTEEALAVLQRHPLGQSAQVIGRTTAEGRGFVRLHTAIGGTRLLDMLTDDLLPRIC